MKVTIENLALCSDCTMAAINDDYTGLDYHYTEAEAAERLEEIRDGLTRLGSGLCHDSSRDEDEFSSRRCDCCGSGLAGRRNYFLVLGE